jgi:hypothetical protein
MSAQSTLKGLMRMGALRTRRGRRTCGPVISAASRQSLPGRLHFAGTPALASLRCLFEIRVL